MADGHSSCLGGKMLSCCEVEFLLDDYIDGEIDPILRERFDRHLAHCELCSCLVHECQHIVEVARTLANQPVPASVSRRLRERLEEETGCRLPGVGLQVVDSDSK
jgi:anti-sigma factor RsiW